MLDQLRLKLHKKYIQNRFSESFKKRRSVNLERSKSIGILFLDPLDNRRDIIFNLVSSLQKKGKKVEVLAYQAMRKPDTSCNFKYISEKDLDFLLRPSSEIAHDFVQKEFDLLLCIAEENLPQFEYLSAVSKAHLRIGPATPNQYAYDMMVEVSPRSDFKKFIDQTQFYLTKINRDEFIPA